jgi:hypothetical protein
MLPLPATNTGHSSVTSAPNVEQRCLACQKAGLGFLNLQTESATQHRGLVDDSSDSMLATAMRSSRYERKELTVTLSKKLALSTLIGLMSAVCSAQAEDQATKAKDDSHSEREEAGAKAWDVQSVQEITLEQQDVNGDPVRCTITALVPQGTTKKLAFRGEFNCTGAVDMTMQLYEDVSYDSGTSGDYYLHMEYFTNQQSGGYTAYERYIDDYGGGIVYTKIKGVASVPPTGRSPDLIAVSTGVHLN